VQVQALVDATDDNTDNVVIGYAQAVVQDTRPRFRSTGCASAASLSSPPQ